MSDVLVRLEEAKAALHSLHLGKRIVSLTVDGVDRHQSEYQKADIPALQSYIKQLQQEAIDEGVLDGASFRRGAVRLSY